MNIIHVGTFGSPIGLKGEIKINILTSSFDLFKNLGDYFNEDYSVKWYFKNMRLQNNKIIVLLDNYNNRNDIKNLSGTKIFTSINNFPKIKKNEYYVKDLIECCIYIIGGKKIGNVINVDNFGAGDLLETKIKNKKIYIPFNDENLVSVNLNKKQIIVNPIKGIID